MLRWVQGHVLLYGWDGESKWGEGDRETIFDCHHRVGAMKNIECDEQPTLTYSIRLVRVFSLIDFAQLPIQYVSPNHTCLSHPCCHIPSQQADPGKHTQNIGGSNKQTPYRQPCNLLLQPTASHSGSSPQHNPFHCNPWLSFYNLKS